MVPIHSYLKPPPFGVMLYGIPPLALLFLVLVPSGHPSWDSVQIYLAIGNAISLFIISTALGTVVDNYFRSAPEASFSKILIAGSFAWSFLIATSMLVVGYLAFNAYGTNHHSNLLPQDIYSSGSAFLGRWIQATFLGGILFLPLNSLLVFLVRRRYRRPNP
jgi:hypothetical protein